MLNTYWQTDSAWYHAQYPIIENLVSEAKKAFLNNEGFLKDCSKLEDYLRPHLQIEVRVFPQLWQDGCGGLGFFSA